MVERRSLVADGPVVEIVRVELAAALLVTVTVAGLNEQTGAGVTVGEIVLQEKVTLPE
jgi:hypothetical protein